MEIEPEPREDDQLPPEVRLVVDLRSDLLDPLDAWIRGRPVEMTRQQAIRYFLQEALQMRGYISEPEDSVLTEWEIDGEPN